MDSLKQKMKNISLFLKRDAKLKQRLKTDYIENGIASLPCRVSGMDDIISPYSVRGFETLLPEFSEYIESAAAFIPAEYPIMLEISGCAFSAEEQKTITRTIHEDFIYELGAVQRENNRQLIIAFLMLVGMIATGFLTFFAQGIEDVAVEIIYVFFWFFSDLVVCFFLLDGFENRKKRILAGRLADMTVYFSKEYDDSAISDEDAKLVYDELEKMTYQGDAE